MRLTAVCVCAFVCVRERESGARQRKDTRLWMRRCDLCWNASMGSRMPTEENDIFRAGRGIVFRWEIVGKRREPASRAC